MRKNKPTWKNVKTVLTEKSSSEILKLVGDLYALTEGNKSFIHSRYFVALRKYSGFCSRYGLGIL